MLVNLLVLLMCAAGGFATGIAVVVFAPSLHGRPRLPMAVGAAVMPLIWAAHCIVGTYPRLFGLDMFLMMTGVGLVAAGWDAEKVIEEQHEEERVRRLRTAWEKQRESALPNHRDAPALPSYVRPNDDAPTQQTVRRLQSETHMHRLDLPHTTAEPPVTDTTDED